MIYQKEQPSQHKKTQHQQKYLSQSVRRNSLIFSIIMVCLQITISLLYIYKINVPPQLINIGSVITTIGLAILVVAGFGLLFGYSGSLLWSSIGFSFFITALCLQLYPLINDFWTRTVLQSQNFPIINFSDSETKYNIFLTNRQTSTTGMTTFYGNCITNAIKCALACSIAFSAILGRAGSLQCLIVTIFGVIGFELNRQIIQENQGADTFGTFYIFTFGGFMSLLIGFWQYLRQFKFRKVQIQNNTEQYFQLSLKRSISNQYTVLQSLFGSLIIFAFFPFLSYQIDAYTYFNDYSMYSNPLSLILAMGAGTIGAMIITLFINGQIIVRDIIHGPVAGAIAVGASTLYITNPVYSIIAGFVGGLSQSIIQNLIQKYAIRRKIILTTISWSLFGIQGIIGSLFAWGWKAIFNSNSNNLPISFSVSSNFQSQYQLYSGLISAGVGTFFGLVTGLIIFFVNRQKSQQYYHDGYYWVGDDGNTYIQLLQENNGDYKQGKVQTIPSNKIIHPVSVDQSGNQNKKQGEDQQQSVSSSNKSKNIDDFMFFADLV